MCISRTAYDIGGLGSRCLEIVICPRCAPFGTGVCPAYAHKCGQARAGEVADKACKSLFSSAHVLGAPVHIPCGAPGYIPVCRTVHTRYVPCVVGHDTLVGTPGATPTCNTRTTTQPLERLSKLNCSTIWGRCKCRATPCLLKHLVEVFQTSPFSLCVPRPALGELASEIRPRRDVITSATRQLCQSHRGTCPGIPRASTLRTMQYQRTPCKRSRPPLPPALRRTCVHQTRDRLPWRAVHTSDRSRFLKHLDPTLPIRYAVLGPYNAEPTQETSAR